MVLQVRLMKVFSPRGIDKGDNYVISQQTARACLKYMANPRDLPPSAKYLSQSSSSFHISSAKDWNDGEIQLQVLEARARQAIIKLDTLLKQGTPWKDLNFDCVAVSRAHSDVFVLRTFLTTVSEINSSLFTPLTKLRNLVTPSIFVNCSLRYTLL
jgi:hypothetical protein